MPTPELPEKEHLYRKDAVEQELLAGANPFGVDAGGTGSSVGRAAKVINRARGVMDHWARRQIALKQAGKPNFCPDWSLFKAPIDKPLAPSAIEERKSLRDTEFYKRQAASLTKALTSAEHAAEEIAGVRGQTIVVPDWLMPKPSKEKHKSVLGLLLSDLHAGEVVDPDEVLGLNAYNPDICRKRIRRYFQAACEIGPRWTADTDNQGAILFLGGDLISGDIHEELRITNGLTAHEQVRLAVEEITAGICALELAFGTVHVVSVPGNHGRTTLKPTAKLYSKLSYDTLVASMVQDRFTGLNPSVTFQIGTSPDAIVPVLGHTVFLTHGDKMGSGGGQGFIGPLAPIVRGTKKVEAQQARAQRRPDLILHGHFHTSANPGNVLANGSIPGYTEYGNGLRASIEPPQQWLFLLHERWCLRERVEVRLEEPVAPPLPRVRVPAAMAVA